MDMRPCAKIAPTCVTSKKTNLLEPVCDFNNLHLQTLLDSHDFLLPVEQQNLNEDSQLYYVEEGELLRLTSPFMVSGIYKKIACGNEIQDAPNPNKSNYSKNVHIIESSEQGCIVYEKNFTLVEVAANEGGACDSATMPTTDNGTEIVPPVTILHIENISNNANVASLESVQDFLAKAARNGETKKQWDALAKMSYNLFKLNKRDHVVIDRTSNEIVRTAFGTNEKSIYRFLTPESMQLKPPKETTSSMHKETAPIRSKRGRPRKKQSSVSETFSNPPNQHEVSQTFERPKPIEPSPLATTRTRSGRIVKLLHKSSLSSNGETKLSSNNAIKEYLADMNDATFYNSKPIPPINLNDNQTATYPSQPLATDTPTKRPTPANAICPTCKKIFRGRLLQRHFLRHPDHVPPSKQITNDYQEDISLFRFLVTKLQKSDLNEDQRAEIFLHEINDFVEQLQLRSSRLIRNTSGLHFVTSRTARVLGIPEGQYALDMSAIEAPLEPEYTNGLNEQLNCNVLMRQPANLDITGLSMSLDDEAAQKLNLSAGGKLLPPSEESLLRNVVDLVPNPIKKLGDSQDGSTNIATDGASLVGVPPHYDHVSDNAVEATNMKETPTVTVASTPLLELAVDFFQFKKN